MRYRIGLIFIVVAALGFFSGYFAYAKKSVVEPAPDPFFIPPKPPFEHFIAADGLLLGAKGNIFIRSPISEIVEKIWVTPGDHVKTGDPLFKMNDEFIKKDLEIAEREYDISLAQYQKLLALPRPEEVPPLEADVKQKNASYEEALARYALYQNISNERAVSVDERLEKKFATFAGQYLLEGAEARLNLLKAGAWEKDLAVARAELAQRQARIDRIQVTMERHIIRAPSEGTILKINITVGDYAMASDIIPDPSLIMADLSMLSLKVNVPEEEIWRVCENAEGVAFVRGNSQISIPLEFVKIAPFAEPKKNIAGFISEEIFDIRTLPVFYRFARKDLPVYPGEMLDVYLEAKPYR